MIKHTKKRWEDKEIETLIRMWDRDAPIARIALRLKRTAGEVRSKVSNLRRAEPKLQKKLRFKTINENYKLTAGQIPAIRLDKRPLKIIGKEHGVSAVTIFKIKAGETWRNA
jgi:hypothetical protein